MTAAGFPVFKTKIASTLLNWAPKLAKTSSDLTDLLQALDWSTYKSITDANGSMTFTETESLFQYIRLNDLVLLCAKAKGTTGGVASTAIRFRLPFTAREEPVEKAVFTGLSYENGTYGSSFAHVDSDLVTVSVRLYNGANWGIGANRAFALNGFYRVK